MSENEAGAGSSGEAVVKLLANYGESDEDQTLVDELAMRAVAMGQDPAIAGSYEPEYTIDFKEMGLTEDLREIGTRMIRRIERELHGVVCGSSKEDDEDRKKIVATLGAGKQVVGAAIVGVLVSSFGIGPAVAAVAAALIIRRIITPAGDEAHKALCEKWTAALSKNQ